MGPNESGKKEDRREEGAGEVCIRAKWLTRLELIPVSIV